MKEELDSQKIELIEKTIKEFLEKLGIKETKINSKILEEEGKEIAFINIEIERKEISSLLIGEKGLSLLGLQHLLKLIFKKKTDSSPAFMIDINNYRESKKKYLESLANSKAKEAKFTTKPVELNPMTSFERRIIHLALAGDKEVITESVGKEKERRIVIKPII